MERTPNPAAAVAIITLIFGIAWFFSMMPAGGLAPLVAEPLMVWAPAMNAPARIVAATGDEMPVVTLRPRPAAGSHLSARQESRVEIAPQAPAVAPASSISAPLALPTASPIAAAPMLVIVDLVPPVESVAPIPVNRPAGWVTGGFVHAGSALKVAMRKTGDGLGVVRSAAR